MESVILIEIIQLKNSRIHDFKSQGLVRETPIFYVIAWVSQVYYHVLEG